MTFDSIALWAKQHPLSEVHVDCTTAVMLKILDGKCKMKEEEKVVMERLYDQVKNRPGKLLGDENHLLIAAARGFLDDEIRNVIYEQRLIAETMISRPVMKKFKAMLRQRGLFSALPG